MGTCEIRKHNDSLEDVELVSWDFLGQRLKILLQFTNIMLCSLAMEVRLSSEVNELINNLPDTKYLLQTQVFLSQRSCTGDPQIPVELHRWNMDFDHTCNSRTLRCS